MAITSIRSEDFFEKVDAAIGRAQEKLIAERARNNETVVLNINGKPQNVSAKSLIASKKSIGSRG